MSYLIWKVSDLKWKVSYLIWKVSLLKWKWYRHLHRVVGRRRAVMRTIETLTAVQALIIGVEADGLLWVIAGSMVALVLVAASALIVFVCMECKKRKRPMPILSQDYFFGQPTDYSKTRISAHRISAQPGLVHMFCKSHVQLLYAIVPG